MPRKSKKEISAPTSEAPVEKATLPASSILAPNYGFDILGDNDISESIERVLESVGSMRKNYTVQFNRMSDVREKMLPVKHFYLQWLLGLYGIPESCLIEIIGAEGLGKTTLAFQLIGWAMDSGCPAYYIECENKQLSPGRILRALHPNKERAAKMLKRLRKSQVFSLDELENELDTIVDVIRGKRTLKGAQHVPMHVPLLIVVDPWSKLMNLDEVAGRSEYGDNMSDSKRAKMKASGTGRTMGHSMWAHSFCRRLPKLLSANNIILVVVHHQNDEVDMGGMGGMSLPKEVQNLYNKTKIGGRAFNQNAAVQLILAKGGMTKTSSGEVKGRKVNVRVDKNSFGPGDRKLTFEIRTDHYDDTEQFLEPAINFDEDWANWMASNKFLGTTVSRKRYTCPSLGIEGATYNEFYRAFNSNEEVKQELGRRLRIEGYINTVDNILSVTNSNQPPIEAVHTATSEDTDDAELEENTSEAYN